MTRSVEFEVKATNATGSVFAEVTAALKGIAAETKSVREEERLEAAMQRELTAAIKEMRAAQEAARLEVQRAGKAVEEATLGPYERYLSAQLRLGELRSKNAISAQAHAAALEQEKQKYLALATSAGKVNPVVEAKRVADTKAKEAAQRAAEADRQRRIELQRTGDAIRQSVLTPAAAYEQEVRRLNRALREGAIDQKTHAAAIRKAGGDYKAATGGARGFGGGLLNSAAMRIAGPLAATFGAAALTREMRDSFTELDELAKRSDRLSIIPAELQKLQYAASMSGVEVGTLDSALEAYVKRTGNADRITGKTADALGKLKINASDLKGLSLPEEMRLLADGFAGVADGEERLNLAMALFGSSGAEMLNVLGEGSAALDAMFRERESIGGLFSRDDLEGIEAANDAMDRAATALKGAMNEAATGLAPVVEDLANSLTEWVKMSRGGRSEKEARAAKFKDTSEFGKDIPFANAGANLGLAQERAGWDTSKVWGGAADMTYGKDSGWRYSGWGSWQKVATQNLSPAELERIGREAEALEAETDAALARRRAVEQIPEMRPDGSDGRTMSSLGGYAGMLGRAGNDGASLLGRGVASLDALGLAAGNAVRNSRGELESAARRAEENVKEGQRAREEQSRAADSLRRGNMTPAEVFAENKRKADELLAAGLIDQSTYDRELSRAGAERDRGLEPREKDRSGPPPELQALISRTLTRGSTQTPEQKTERNTAELLKETRETKAIYRKMQVALEHLSASGVVITPVKATR